MNIERHIFGSVSGYTTLGASAGLSADDCRFLESGAYGFGQTDVGNYLASLERRPAFFTRPMRGGRRALTRVLKGDPDDNGRPTLLMVSVVVSELEWNTTLCGDIGLLLAATDLWAYERGTPPAAIDRAFSSPRRSIDRRHVPALLAALSAVETSQGRGVPIGERDLPPEAMIALEMLIPTPVRSRFSLAYRSLSPQLAVSINAVADIHAAPRQLDLAKPLSPYAEALVAEGVESGRLPIGTAARYGSFGREPERYATSGEQPRFVPPPQPQQQKQSRWKATALVLLALLIVGGGIATALYMKGDPGVAATQPSAETPPATTAPSETPSTAPASVPAVSTPPPPAPAERPATASAESKPSTAPDKNGEEKEKPAERPGEKTVSGKTHVEKTHVEKTPDGEVPGDTEASSPAVLPPEQPSVPATSPTTLPTTAPGSSAAEVDASFVKPLDTEKQREDLRRMAARVAFGKFELALNQCDGMLLQMKGRDNVLDDRRENLVRNYVETHRKLKEGGLIEMRGEFLEKGRNQWYDIRNPLMEQLGGLISQCDELEKKVARCEAAGPDKLGDQERATIIVEIKREDVPALRQSIKNVQIDALSQTKFSFLRAESLFKRINGLKEK